MRSVKDVCALVLSNFPLAAQSQLACTCKRLRDEYRKEMESDRYRREQLDKYLNGLAPPFRQDTIAKLPNLFLWDLMQFRLPFLSHMTFRTFFLYFPLQPIVYLEIAYIQPNAEIHRVAFNLYLHAMLAPERLLFAPSLFLLLHGLKYQLTDEVEAILETVEGVFDYSWAITHVNFACVNVISGTTKISYAHTVSMGMHVPVLEEMIGTSFGAPIPSRYTMQLLNDYLYTYVIPQ